MDSQATYTPPMSKQCGDEGKHEQCVGLVYRMVERWCACSCDCHKPKKQRRKSARGEAE